MKKIVIWFGLFLFIISVNIEAQRIRDIDPLGFAKKIFEEGFYSIALDQFKQFLNEHPESESVYIAQYYVGECYFRMNDFKSASEEFFILTVRYPEAPNVVLGWEGRGRCSEEMNNFKEAAEIFETAGNYFFYKGDVASPFFLYAGRDYLKIDNIKKAKENFLRIVDNYPGSEPAYEATYQLGLIYLKEGDALSALKEFEKVKYISEKPIIAAGSRLLSGKIYMKIGDFKKSENEFIYVIENYKSNIEYFNDARLNLGITYILGNAYEKGRDILIELIKETNLSDSLLIRGMIAIGDSYFYEGNYSEAESKFSEIIDKYPQSSMTGEIFYKLGLCFENEGNEEQSLYSFHRSIEYSISNGYLDDFQKKSLDKLVSFYEQKKQYKETANYLEKFSNYFDGDSESLLTKTASFYEKGMDFTNAVRIYGILEDKFIGSPNIDYYIFKKGVCLEKEGSIKEARKEYKKLMNGFAGCDYADEVNIRFSLLENLNVEDKQSGIQLFELINPVEGKDKIEDNNKRTFELGKYYYNINEFDKAITYFKIVLDNKEDREILEKAGEFVALSYDNIAKRYYIDGEFQKYRAYLDSALNAYSDYLESEYFTKDFIDYAKIRKAEISIEKESDKFEKKRKGLAYYTLLNNDKEFSKRDFVLLRLGEIYTDLEVNSETNELQIGRDCFDELIRDFPNSEYAEKAKFKLGYSYYISDELDKASEIFKKYLIEYLYGMYAPAVTACLGKIELSSDSESSEYFKILSEKFYYSNYVDSTLEQWGDFYFNKGEFEKAVEKYIYAFERAEVEMLIEDEDIDDKIIDLSIKIASAYDSLGNFHKAVAFLNDLIDKRQIKNISQIYYNLGRIYEDANYNEKAIEIYKRIEEEFPEEEFIKDILKRKSEILFDMGKFADSFEGYEKLAEITEEPSEKVKYESNAIISLYRNDDISRGDEEVKIFLKENKDLEDIDFYKYQYLLEKGKSYYRNEDFNSAMRIFEDVTKNGEKTEIAPEAELYIGLIYQYRKDKIEALTHFNSIMTKFPETKIWSKVYNTVGIYYYGLGQYQDAAKYFKMAIENSSGKEDRIAFNNLILSYRYSGWFDSEINALRRYISLFPEADDIFSKKFDIGLALLNNGDYKSAVEQLKPLLPLATLEGEVEIQMKIAEAYEELGNNEKAILEWLKVLYYGRSAVPKLKTSVRFRLAKICERVGMYDKALQFYEEIVEEEGAATDLGRPAKIGIERTKERIESIGGYKNR